MSLSTFVRSSAVPLCLAALLVLSLACHRQPRLPSARESKPADASTPILAVGAKAPDFALPDSKGTTVTLSSFQGQSNVVLVFYPADDTFMCTKQLCAIRDAWADYRKANATVFGVNPQSAKTHRKFIEKQKYPFELLVDADKEVCTAYGANGTISTVRTVYCVDKTGTIVFAERGVPSNKKILAAFARK